THLFLRASCSRAQGVCATRVEQCSCRENFARRASMISQRAKYALHALIALARAKGPLSTNQIAESERIPSAFLELMQVKHHGIVKSKRGRFGGYDLLLPADHITFGQILRIVDGPIAPTCMLKPHRLSALSRLPQRADLQSATRVCQSYGEIT